MEPLKRKTEKKQQPYYSAGVETTVMITDMQDMEGTLNKSTQLSLSSLEYCFCLYFVTFTSFIRSKWNFWCERRSHFI